MFESLSKVTWRGEEELTLVHRHRLSVSSLRQVEFVV